MSEKRSPAKQAHARDRMVMAGLVCLGFLTVAAGFASGRSTFQYALATDAREASVALVEQIEERLDRAADEPIEVGGHRLVVKTPALLPDRPGRHARIAQSIHENSGLLAGIDWLMSGWISRLLELLDADNHVSRVVGISLLDPLGQVVLQTTPRGGVTIDAVLADPGFQATFHKSLGLQTAQFVSGFGKRTDKGANAEFHKLLLLPVVNGPQVERIYAVQIDQSTAATMSKVTLVAVSMMTSLLIVLGYSVPAAIAVRRIRERWRVEEQIRFLALHDPLTGLPNRVQLHNRLETSIARARRSGNLMAVMCLDLDRFKDVNDTLGHQTGDALLKEAAERLRACVRETDVIARLGGDEFAIVVEDMDTANFAVQIARRVCDSLAKPFNVNGHTLATSGSVGISLGPTEGVDPDGLLNNADLALYRAKQDGRNTFRFFEPEMDRVVQERRRMANDLQLALRNGELALHYQPLFDLNSGRITGYEALARWTHPTYGEVPPKVFIPIAEESGLIAPLGEWVLRTACSYASRWPADTTLAVNVSPTQFRAQDVVALVEAALRESGFAPDRLHLEITEGLLMKNTDEMIETLKRLDALGVSLSLDDFGTGYSSLSYLTRFPVRKIKIDQSFIEKMESDKETNAIVSTIVGLGKSLNVTITAEGVENERQAEMLRRLGCNEVQGFLYGRPREEIVLPARSAPAPAMTPNPAPAPRDWPELPEFRVREPACDPTALEPAPESGPVAPPAPPRPPAMAEPRPEPEAEPAPRRSSVA